MRAWFQRAVLARPWAAFLVMVASFLGFGAGTLNLFYLLQANIGLLVEHGWYAAMEGGLLQLAQLIVTALASMAAWLVFKACEQRLVQAITHKESSPS